MKVCTSECTVHEHTTRNETIYLSVKRPKIEEHHSIEIDCKQSVIRPHNFCKCTNVDESCPLASLTRTSYFYKPAYTSHVRSWSAQRDKIQKSKLERPLCRLQFYRLALTRNEGGKTGIAQNL